MAVALHAGFPAERIALHGNNKSVEELTAAVKAGIEHVVLDSMIEIERLDEIAGAAGVVQDVLVRVTVGVEAHTHEFISTAHEDQKFGLSLASGAAMAAVRRVFATDHLRLVGLHSHIGSQIFDVAGFEIAAHRVIGLLRDVVAEFGVEKTSQMSIVDLGGGLGISYLPQDDPPPVAELAAKLSAIVRDESAAVGLPAPQVGGRARPRHRRALAPSRSIEVGTVKDVAVASDRYRRYVSVDGGMSDNIRTSLYGAEYDVRLISRVSEGSSTLGRIVGKHCESGDIVVRDTWVPDDIKPGDLLGRRGHWRLLLFHVEPLQPDRPPRGGGRARWAGPPDPAPGDGRRSTQSGSEVSNEHRREADRRSGLGIRQCGQSGRPHHRGERRRTWPPGSARRWCCAASGCAEWPTTVACPSTC